MAIVKIIREGLLLDSDKEGHVYPVTVFEAVLDSNSKNLEDRFKSVDTKIGIVEGTIIKTEEAMDRVEEAMGTTNLAVASMGKTIENWDTTINNINNTTSTMYNIKGVIKASDVTRGINLCTELIAQPGDCTSVSSFNERDLYFLTTPGTYNLSGTPKEINTLHMAIYQNGGWQYLDMQIPLIPSLEGVEDNSYLKYSSGKLIWSIK